MPLSEKEVDEEMKKLEEEERLLEKKKKLKDAREKVAKLRSEVNPPLFKKLANAGKKGDDLMADVLGLPRKKKEP